MDSVEYREQLENRRDERGRSAESAAREAADGLRGALEALADGFADTWAQRRADADREPPGTTQQHVDVAAGQAWWVAERNLRAVLAAHPADAPEAPEPSGDVVGQATQVLYDVHGAEPRIKAHALADAGLLADLAATEHRLVCDQCLATKATLRAAQADRNQWKRAAEITGEEIGRWRQSLITVEGERDRARDLAAALESENARLTEALREFVDSRGVNVGESDSEWYRGYRQAQRECLLDARKIDAAPSDTTTEGA